MTGGHGTYVVAAPEDADAHSQEQDSTATQTATCIPRSALLSMDMSRQGPQHAVHQLGCNGVKTGSNCMARHIAPRMAESLLRIMHAPAVAITYYGTNIDSLAGRQGDGCQVGSVIEAGARASAQALVAW